MFRLGRLTRALIALLLCGCLLTVTLWNRQQLVEVLDNLGLAMVSTSWKISELVYEGEQLSTALVLFTHDEMSQADLQLQFDVFWSRVNLLQDLHLTSPTLLATLDDFDALLIDFDPIIYSETPADDAVLIALRNALKPMIVTTRRAWLEEYNRAAFADLSPATRHMTEQKAVIETISAIIFCAIVAYLMLELFLAARATRREQELANLAYTASEAKSRFIASISHEIRTPLNGMIGTAALLGETRLDREQKEYVTILQQAGGVLLATINDVLDYSKLDAGEFSIHSIDFDLGDILSCAKGLYEPLARKKEVRLTIWQDAEAMPRLHGDGRRLQQVLNNLISNAIKFTDTGTVEVAARFRDKPGDGEPEGLHIRVTDTGIGVRAEDFDRIFRPFGQSNDGLARVHGGTGLGLSISRDLCRAMGGDLTLTSVFGEGSTFDVFVPFAIAAPRTRPEPGGRDAGDIVSGSVADLRLLIVDDNKTNRFVLGKYLASFGCVPEEAVSGREAIRLCMERTFDAVLMDVQMPEMDGMEATQRILRHCAVHEIPPPVICGVTANTLPEQIEAYKLSGMTHVMSKPVSKSLLRQVLGKVSDARSGSAVA